MINDRLNLLYKVKTISPNDGDSAEVLEKDLAEPCTDSDEDPHNGVRQESASTLKAPTGKASVSTRFLR